MKIKLEENADVSDLKKAIKSKLHPKLEAVALDLIHLRLFGQNENLAGNVRVSTLICLYDEPLQIIASPSQRFLEASKIRDINRKGYKRETATKSERALLSTMAGYLHSKYEFSTRYSNVSFGDVLFALKFSSTGTTERSFRYIEKTGKSERIDSEGGYTLREGTVGFMENVYSKEQWKFMIELNNHVNDYLHSVLRRELDGTTVVIIENDYCDKVLIGDILLKSKVEKIDIKNADSDSAGDSPK